MTYSLHHLTRPPVGYLLFSLEMYSLPVLQVFSHTPWKLSVKCLDVILLFQSKVTAFTQAVHSHRKLTKYVFSLFSLRIYP